ncbi:hypothetical protein [Actinoplanes xinjiangensis]|uniref:hypothetical protein n=1 Tax=Actinoplanes xinjiangensis TaxID=512350 RepID=UPI00344386C8
MTFLRDSFERQDDVAAPTRPGTRVWSRRGLVQTVIGSAGWLLLIPLMWRAQVPLFGGFYLGLSLLFVAFLFAALVSVTMILVACVQRSWGVALVSLVLAATAVVVATRQDSEGDYIDYRYQAHRTALAALAEDYRAGRLRGEVTLPSDVRPLSPSGIAYASPTVLFVQMWQNWRAESGTGLAYFIEPSTGKTTVTTAAGDFGYPQREVGDGWWWVA